MTTPKRIRSLGGGGVKMVACGDAHSLVLMSNGKVYGWGYTNAGQLGLGITGDNVDANPIYNTIQIREPVIIESLANLNITKVTMNNLEF